MAEVVTGLSGTEIINDILAQIEARLKRDCNLRDNDSYNRGFSAKIEIHVQCYGLDVASVDSYIDIGTPQDDPEEVVVTEKIEISQEENLTSVRERSQAEPAGDLLDKQTDGVPVGKRQYKRRLPVTAGGSEGVIDDGQ